MLKRLLAVLIVFSFCLAALPGCGEETKTKTYLKPEYKPIGGSTGGAPARKSQAID